MQHPLLKYTSTRLHLIFLALTIVLMVILRLLDPNPSIVAMEFAGDYATAQNVLQTWGDEGLQKAKMSTYLDFLFLLIYSTTIALFCLKAALKWKDLKWVLTLGIFLAWGQWVAAALDAIENIAMLQTMGGATGNVFPQIAFWCAAVKFALVGLGILYVPAAHLFYRVRKD